MKKRSFLIEIELVKQRGIFALSSKQLMVFNVREKNVELEVDYKNLHLSVHGGCRKTHL